MNNAVGRSAHLTLRTDINLQADRQSYAERDIISDGVDWEVYVGPNFLHKRKCDSLRKTMVDSSFTCSEPVPTWEKHYPRMQKGIAHAMVKFGEGAERVVYQCTEVVSFDGGKTGYCVGPRLVAKSSRYKEHLDIDQEFHREFCHTQGVWRRSEHIINQYETDEQRLAKWGL